MGDDLTLGETTGTLRTFMDVQRDQHNRIEAKLDAIDGRIRSLEHKAAVSGALSGTLSGALTSLAVALATWWLTRAG
jgi:hypothetical protein